MKFGDHPYRYAGYAGLGVFAALFVFSILNSFLSNFISAGVLVGFFNPIEALIISILSAVFFYGFAYLGRKVNLPWLRIMSWLSIVLVFVTLIVVYSLLVSNDLISLASSDPATLNDFLIEISESLESQTYFEGFVTTLLTIHFFIAILWGLQGIFFGISLIKLSEHMAPARKAGILTIIGGATLIIVIGYIFMLVAYIYNVILMVKIAGANTRQHSRPKRKAKKKR